MTRSPLFNFLLGTAAGMVLATVPLLEHFAHVAQRDVAAHEAVVRELQDHIEKAHTAIQEHQQRLESCEAAGQRMNGELQAQDFRDRWYTLVYEPDVQFSPTPQAQALSQILNVWRPGLGTVLARLQSAPQPGMQLRMVLHGYVRPEQLPPSVHMVYTLAQPAESAVQ